MCARTYTQSEPDTLGECNPTHNSLNASPETDKPPVHRTFTLSGLAFKLFALIQSITKSRFTAAVCHCFIVFIDNCFDSYTYNK